MKRNLNKIAIAGCLLLSGGVIFTMSVKATALESLGSKVIPSECVSKLNHDCRSSHTGNIYSDHIWQDKGK